MFAVITKTLRTTRMLSTRARAKFLTTDRVNPPVTVTYNSRDTVEQHHELAASRLILRQFPTAGDPRGNFANWVRGDTADGFVFVYINSDHPIRTSEGEM